MSDHRIIGKFVNQRQWQDLLADHGFRMLMLVIGEDDLGRKLVTRRYVYDPERVARERQEEAEWEEEQKRKQQDEQGPSSNSAST